MAVFISVALVVMSPPLFLILLSLYSPVSNTEIESVIKTPPTQRSPGPDGFPSELYQIFKRELMPVLLRLFGKTEKEETLPNSFYGASITLTPQPDTDAAGKPRTSISYERTRKNPRQNNSQPNPIAD